MISSACCFGQEEGSVSLKMTLSPYLHQVEQEAYLYYLQNNEYIICDSVHVMPDCDTYVLHGSVPYEDIVHLMFTKRGPADLQLLVCPHDNITLTLNEEDDVLGVNYKQVEGSEHNSLLVNYWEAIRSYNKKIELLKREQSLYDKTPSEIQHLQDSIDFYKGKRENYPVYMASSTPSPYLAYLCQVVSWRRVDHETYQEIIKSNYMRFSSYPPIVDMYEGRPSPAPSNQTSLVRNFIYQLKQDRISFHHLETDTLTLGEQPELVLIDSLGHATPLSSYRGKYVLLELWASWCAPCIKAMPNILLAQRQFADDFVCCAISIDKSASAWKQRIAWAGLETLKHYKATDANGDLLPDMRRLAAHGSIPQNYLLDRDGRIIAINLYGEELIKKLKELTAYQ